MLDDQEGHGSDKLCLCEEAQALTSRDKVNKGPLLLHLVDFHGHVVLDAFAKARNIDLLNLVFGCTDVKELIECSVTLSTCQLGQIEQVLDEIEGWTENSIV